jgi:hypothetical protein
MKRWLHQRSASHRGVGEHDLAARDDQQAVAGGHRARELGVDQEGHDAEVVIGAASGVRVVLVLELALAAADATCADSAPSAGSFPLAIWT